MSNPADDNWQAATDAPEDYETLIHLIHERYEDMSKTYQKISLYLTQNPNEIAVNPVSALANRCNIHASSFVRFAQSLGYTGFKELQVLFQKRLEIAAPGIASRVRALEQDLGNRDDSSDIGFLRELIVKDIASLEELLNETSATELAVAADLLHQAETVFLIGQLRSAPVVDFIRYMLTMIGKQCILLDACGGLATHVAKTMKKSDVLVAVSFRYYATEVVSIVEQAEQSGQPVVAISDSTLSPIAKSANVLFTVPEHQHTFSRSLAAPMCLAQALVLSVAARAQKNESYPIIASVTEKRQ